MGYHKAGSDTPTSPSDKEPSPDPVSPKSAPVHVWDTTELADHLKRFTGRPVRQAHITSMDVSGLTHQNQMSHIFHHVRVEHPEFFSSKGACRPMGVIINEELCRNIEGLKKDSPTG